uniref:C2 domain-containing protein n=1 Tax=Oryza punctata TaxID=4537 RepID=A0A0E0JTQ2_ORYPU
MESARFVYEMDHGGEADEEEESGSGSRHSLACFLDIYVHDARGIHNICIYAAQDVYAKFALTSSPDDAPALATRVAAGGGANPRFDERLPPLRVRRARLGTDVLKCEIWMRSCAKRLLEDQLLGFALVPLATVAAADGARLAQDFSLSSTDLFHSPAGTIRLSLALQSGPPGDACPPPERAAEPSITSEVVILEPAPPVDYARIEFPDLNAVKENDDMAVQYLPFLHLGDAQAMDDDCEMATSPREEKTASSDDGSKNASTSTTTAVSDDNRVISSSEATHKARPDADDAAIAPMSCRSPGTPTSNGGKSSSAKEKGAAGDDMEAEQSAMQRQIMEMYMKSMQQFTESLSKMKLPMELDGDNGVVVQKEEKPEAEVKLQPKKVKDGARLYLSNSIP